MVHRSLLRRALLAGAVLAVCSVGAVQVGALSQPAADADDLEASVGGEAVVEQDGQHYAWVGDGDRLEITVAGYPFPENDSRSEVELCLESATESTWSDRGCSVTSVANASAPPLNATIALDDRFEPGDLRVRTSLTSLQCADGCDEGCEDDADCGAESLGSAEFGLQLLERTGDLDDDGLANDEEVAAGTAIGEPDTDADGLEDGPELDQYETDPLDEDTDDDGLDDAAEVRQWESEPTAADTDGDGLDDAAEIEEYGSDPTDPHSDDDGLDDGAEAHQHDTNPTKTDTDGDGIGDGVELDRGTDPTDPDDPSGSDGPAESGDPNAGESAGSRESGTGPSSSPAPGEGTAGSDEAVQRGFFANDGDASNAALVSETDLTVLGFLFSLLGVVVPLLREG